METGELVSHGGRWRQNIETITWFLLQSGWMDGCWLIRVKQGKLRVRPLARKLIETRLQFSYCCDRVRLCLCGTAAANGPIVSPLDNMKQRWNDINIGKPKDSEKNLSQCHFVHHISHMD
jgi:hypothetical protein